MVTTVDPRRACLAVLFFALGAAGLGYYAYTFHPTLAGALSASLSATTDTLVRRGWAGAVEATDQRSFFINCALLNWAGCGAQFWNEMWTEFRAALAVGYAGLHWPHQWMMYLLSVILGSVLFRTCKRKRPLFDAHFATPGEVKSLLATPRHPATVLLGTLKGRYLGLTADAKGPGRLPHTLVIAPPGTGKSVQLMGVLASWQQTAIVVDVKGELRAATSRWRQRHVGPVYTLTPEGGGERFDPIAALLRLDPDAAEAVAHFLTYDPDDHPKFFASQAKPALLAAIRSAQLANEAVLPHLDGLLNLGNKGFIEALHARGDAEIDAQLTRFLGMPPAAFPETSYADTRGPVFSVWQTLLERLPDAAPPRRTRPDGGQRL